MNAGLPTEPPNADVALTDDDVLAVLATLPERQRLAIFLVHLQGQGIREAARSMGISHVRIQKLLQGAQKNLAASLLYSAKKRVTIVEENCVH